jgi:hypothetical protein
MDQFEAAKARALKNQARFREARERQAEESAIVVPEVPKEKPQEGRMESRDAVIDISVSLPSGGFAIRLVKKDVLKNVPAPVKLNKNEFRNRLIEGLRPLLGAVQDEPHYSGRKDS